MSENIRVYIERVKSACNVVTDQELADKIGYSKQAIASWRRRDNVPVNAELKIIETLGPEFAYSQKIRGLTTAREREVVDAASLFAIERYLLSLRHPVSTKTRRSMGYLFQEIQNAVRTEIRKLENEHEDSLTMLDILIPLIRESRLLSVKRILDRVDLDENEIL